MGKLDGKVAIVTGAGRGMGRAIAAGYLHEGASVVVTAAREQAELDWFSQQEWSQRVLGQLADITNAHSCEQVIAQALQRFGKVDVLVNNAGRGMKYVSSSFIAYDAFQCGYCTPGQICSAIGMLREAEAGWPSAVSADLTADHVTLDDDEIRERMSGNLCRCAAYATIVPAIMEVAREAQKAQRVEQEARR